jgi:hypothetical protein
VGVGNTAEKFGGFSCEEVAGIGEQKEQRGL